MNTNPLRILICSNNEITRRKMARSLSGEGVHIQTCEGIFNHPQFFQQGWNYLVVDLNGIDKFLRKLLPLLIRKHPKMLRIGISTKSVKNSRALDLKLDACLSEIPRLEELIVYFPQVAGKYLCDPTSLSELRPSSLEVFQEPTKSAQVKAQRK